VASIWNCGGEDQIFNEIHETSALLRRSYGGDTAQSVIPLAL